MAGYPWDANSEREGERYQSWGSESEEFQNIKKEMIADVAKEMVKKYVTGSLKTMLKHLEEVGKDIEYLQAAFEIPPK